MPTISRKEYAGLFGPTTGDKIRLGIPTCSSKSKRTCAVTARNRSTEGVNPCATAWVTTTT